MQRLRLEEALLPVLRRQAALQDPAQVLHPRGHRRRARRLQVKSVRVVPSRPEVSRPDEIIEMKMIIICVILFIL